ncbi:hypothetical protein TrLO_g7438 [Triparma laevis f. longispina]|uniref:Uncharacterized protein n=1 Tax=Triparma laevis f. longispina TaxID=1714387 RepID=A0A9W7DQ45_9STRA|nr:hypothetical protein TrLO_g7438 [Triparma laevis f. longispina]
MIGSYSSYNPELVFAVLKTFEDERALVFFTCWLEIIKIAFADAAPEKIRKSMAKYSTSMWLFMACFIVFIYDERFPDLELRFITIGKMTYSSSDVCFLSGINYILFLTVFIVHTLRRPGTFSVIKSNMKSIKLDAHDALPSIMTRSVRNLERSTIIRKTTSPAGDNRNVVKVNVRSKGEKYLEK